MANISVDAEKLSAFAAGPCADFSYDMDNAITNFEEKFGAIRSSISSSWVTKSTDSNLNSALSDMNKISEDLKIIKQNLNEFKETVSGVAKNFSNVKY